MKSPTNLKVAKIFLSEPIFLLQTYFFHLLRISYTHLNKYIGIENDHYRNCRKKTTNNI